LIEENFTALISGAGPAGLATAVLLALDGVKTAVIAPPPQVDPRTTALMQPSMQMLKFIGVWSEDLKSVSAPLKHLHLVDDTGNLVTAPQIQFSASEMDLDEFGWNVPLAHLVPALRHRAEFLGVRFIEATSTSAQVEADCIVVKTSDGQNYSSKILLAADGADSALRTSLGITTENWAFDQSALATSFAHSAPHQCISTEYHKSAGPFTTVPLPGNRSSLVWMDRPARIETLLQLSEAELAIEIQLETKGSLGRISDIGPRKAFPMRGQRATTFASNRCMTIGEAAHVLPPIGAQGLNLSLRDAAQAADLIISAKDPGADSILKEYNTLRRADVVPRQQMVNLMNQSLLSSIPAFGLARVMGLAAIANFAPLRNIAMQQGLAPSANLPFAMRG
jgi:2-octaprenyl-6-methoxyphenol hydroxylase